MTLPAGWTSSPQLSCQTRSPASGCPAVVMVQPTHDRTSDHLVPCILRGRNRSALYRYLLPHALMRSCLVEVHHIGIEDALELPLMQDQYVVQAFLPDTPQEALTDRIHGSDISVLVHRGWLLEAAVPPRHQLESVSRPHGSPCETAVR